MTDSEYKYVLHRISKCEERLNKIDPPMSDDLPPLVSFLCIKCNKVSGDYYQLPSIVNPIGLKKMQLICPTCYHGGKNEI